MLDALQAFHFLRPLWLLAVPLAGLLWWWLRPRPRPSTLARQIAPHLARAMTVDEGQHRRLNPIDATALAAALLALAAAGPAWTRIPNPLVSSSGPLVIALAVTESMETPDLAPNRLERAKFKIRDLIEARAGARTALIAYAGTAHRVAPLTEDPGILRPLLEGLSSKTMPEPGNNAGAAHDLAGQVLQDADTTGAILFVLDDLDPADVEAFPADGPPVIFLVAGPPDLTLPQLDRVPGATVIHLTPDDSDLRRIERRVRAAWAAALAQDDSLQWQDRGWIPALLAALLLLIWFRRGWTMHWVACALAFTLLTPRAQADGLADWFWTADQQGMRAYRQKDFARAGELFADPYWRAYALMKAGKYEGAADIFARLDSAEAAFAEGLSRIRFREYRPAIAAFEKALVRRPDYPEAARNLEVAKVILDYVETTREQSDTGEEAGLGADDVVFDNEAGRGADTQMDVPKEEAAPLTGDQWISAIDTDMGDFLRGRFLLDLKGEAK